MKTIYILAGLLLATAIYAIDDNSGGGGKEPGLIGGIDYKGHDVGLINKHGWEFETQRLFNGYLKNYYTETAGVIKDEMGSAAGWIPSGVIAVSPYGHEKLEPIEPNEHIIDSYGFVRPAIVRYWSGP